MRQKRFGGDSLLIWRTLPAACYLIQRQTGEKAGSRCNFLLFDMEARLGVGATEQTFVFPYHLIALMESQGTLYFRFDPGVLYETAYSKQEFLNFYRRLGQYTVTETWDGFQIMRGKGSVSASDEAREENSGRRVEAWICLCSSYLRRMEAKLFCICPRWLRIAYKGINLNQEGLPQCINCGRPGFFN